MTTHSEILEPKALRRFAFAPVALGIMFFAATTPLFAQRAAQPSWVLQGFASRKEPSSSPVFGGLSFTKYRRILGLRAGGSLYLRNSDNGNTVCGRYGCRNLISVGAWTADADLLLEPLRVMPRLNALLLGFSPYGFIGIGGYGVHGGAAPDSSFATVSYGLGLHHSMLGPLGLQAEARYRQPLENNTGFSNGLRENMEYSIGFTVNLSSQSRHQKKSAPTPRRNAPEESSARFVSTVLDVAESYLNTPYWYGGASPYGGFDAGGFVQYVFARAGVRLPRTAREIAKTGENISLRIGSLHPGDLVFFASDGSNIDHVAIYAGHERIIHATASGGGVRYDVLGEGERGRWFGDHLVSACRVVGSDTPQPPIDLPPDKSAFDPPDVAPPSTRAPR
jgi:cell wall-associated NlpC family hydrolase